MRLHPPLIAVLLAGASFGADALWRAPRWVAPPWTWAGLAPVAGGGALALAALGLFRRRGTTHHPFERPSALVTTGPYRFTRNPMYVGVTSVLAGVAVLSGSLWLLIPPVAFVLWIDRVQIPFEETLLLRQFGPDYEAYRSRVRRWV